MFAMVRCRPVVKLFVVRKKPFRRSPDDEPWLLCLGSKSGGAEIISKHSTRHGAAKALRAALDWLDAPPGQSAYNDAVTYLRNRIAASQVHD